MKGFSIKHALTTGIKAVEVSKSSGRYRYTTGEWSEQLIEGLTFFEKFEDAQAHTRVMAARKIVCLEKQIRKLREIIDNPQEVQK